MARQASSRGIRSRPGRLWSSYENSLPMGRLWNGAVPGPDVLKVRLRLSALICRREVRAGLFKPQRRYNSIMGASPQSDKIRTRLLSSPYVSAPRSQSQLEALSVSLRMIRCSARTGMHFASSVGDASGIFASARCVYRELGSTDCRSSLLVDRPI